jgi:homoserine kinase
VRLTVRVPATSANLGPGFDCFGLALDLCNEVTVDTDAEPGVVWEGEGAEDLPTDGTDVVSRAIAYTVEQQRGSSAGARVPPLALRGLNRIPLQRGLGSSAAAAVAGVAIADALLGETRTGETPQDPHPIYRLAAEIEGHADNAAAATYGGFTIVAAGFVHRARPHDELSPIVLVPRHLTTSTSDARAVLSETIDRRDAVFNIGHASLLAIALTREPSLLHVALRDRVHEDARLVSVPEARDLLRELRESRRIPASVSGAGPSLLAFPPADADVGALPEGWSAIRVPVRSEGVAVDLEA